MSAVLKRQPIEYRPGKPRDLEGVYQLGLTALKADAIEELVIDEKKVRNMAREVLSGAGNYCEIAVQNGRIVAAVSAIVTPMMFYERNCATVVQFFTLVPGAGLTLLRRFLAWARGRSGIKMITFTLEHNADPRVARLLELLGMKRALPVFAEVR